MSWYPANDSKTAVLRSSRADSFFYPGNSGPSMSRPANPTVPLTATPTSSSLGRMPMAPAYPVPMEAEVAPRADFPHVMLRAALGANYLAPIASPSYILDMGCGSGRWVREMAGEFPGARVVGLDITPPADVNPSTSGVYAAQAQQARSFAFIQHNVMEPLPFAPSSFDLAHMRQMMGVLPVASWPRVVGEMARVTAYGGWIELVEGDLARNGGPALELIQHWALQALLPRGLDPRFSSQLADLLRMLSLTDVRTHTLELPVGPHGGRFGELMGADLLARVEGMRGHIIAARLASPEEFTQAQIALRHEMNQREYIQPFYVAYGRR